MQNNILANRILEVRFASLTTNNSIKKFGFILDIIQVLKQYNLFMYVTETQDRSEHNSNWKRPCKQVIYTHEE